MSIVLRLLLIVGSILTGTYVLRRVRQSRMRTEDSIFWLLFAAILVILGLFPGLATSFSEWLGVMSAANLVFLVIIFLLIMKIFLMDERISRLQEQITRNVQNAAIEKLKREDGPERAESDGMHSGTGAPDHGGALSGRGEPS